MSSLDPDAGVEGRLGIPGESPFISTVRVALTKPLSPDLVSAGSVRGAHFLRKRWSGDVRGGGGGGQRCCAVSRRSAERAALAPGCLYTVEMSILKVPMWLIRKARLRLWNTCVGGDDKYDLFVTQWKRRRKAKRETDLNFDDFIKEDLRILLELKLEVLRRKKQRLVSVSQQRTVRIVTAKCWTSL